MCKIFGITSTATLDHAQLVALINRAHVHLTKTQRDGFGYSIAHKGGAHFVEKWDKPDQFPGPNAWPELSAHLRGLAVDADCILTGEFPPPGPALIAHARTSTCERGAANAHPHTKAGWALVHNGVVEPRKGRTHSCDSIHIVESLAKHGSASHLHAELTGYLAILGFDPTGQFFALRDARAPLFVAWVPKMEAWAFASTPELIGDITASQHDKPFSLLPCKLQKWDGLKWRLTDVKAWESSDSGKARRAFGDWPPSRAKRDDFFHPEREAFPDFKKK